MHVAVRTLNTLNTSFHRKKLPALMPTGCICQFSRCQNVIRPNFHPITFSQANVILYTNFICASLKKETTFLTIQYSTIGFTINCFFLYKLKVCIQPCWILYRYNNTIISIIYFSSSLTFLKKI